MENALQAFNNPGGLPAATPSPYFPSAAPPSMGPSAVSVSPGGMVNPVAGVPDYTNFREPVPSWMNLTPSVSADPLADFRTVSAGDSGWFRIGESWPNIYGPAPVFRAEMPAATLREATLRPDARVRPSGGPDPRAEAFFPTPPDPPPYAAWIRDELDARSRGPVLSQGRTPPAATLRPPVSASARAGALEVGAGAPATQASVQPAAQPVVGSPPAVAAASSEDVAAAALFRSESATRAASMLPSEGVRETASAAAREANFTFSPDQVHELKLAEGKAALYSVVLDGYKEGEAVKYLITDRPDGLGVRVLDKSDPFYQYGQDATVGRGGVVPLDGVTPTTMAAVRARANSGEGLVKTITITEPPKTVLNTATNKEMRVLPSGTFPPGFEGGYYDVLELPDRVSLRVSNKDNPNAVYVNSFGAYAVAKKAPEAPKKEWYENPMAMMAVTAGLSLIGVMGQYFMGKDALKSQEKMNRENRNLQLQLAGMQYGASAAGGDGGGGRGLPVGRVYT